MQSLVRLGPFVWKQRLRLLVSFTLAGVIAVLWSGALLLVFPLVKVLLENQSLEDYVALELKRAEQCVVEKTERRQNLDRIREELLRSKDNAGIARNDVDRRDCISDLNDAFRRQWRYGQLSSHLLPYLHPDRFTMLAWIMLFILLLTGVKCCLDYIQETIVNVVVERTMQTLRERLFRSTLNLDQQTLALETTPQLMSRFSFDLQQVAAGMTLLGSKAVTEPMKAIVCIALAFGVNWRLTALSFACAPLAVILFGQLGRRLKSASRRQMESMSRVYRALIEPLQSFTTVLSFRNERLHRRRLARENRDYYGKAMKIVCIDALASPSIEFLAMIGVFVGSLPGAYLVLERRSSIWGIHLSAYQMEGPELLLLYTLLAGVLDPARRIAGIFSKVKKSSAACNRVFGWMERTSLVQSNGNYRPLPRHSASIEFDRVTFQYAAVAEQTERRPALDDVSLTIPFGATVALLGNNGSGKSTLASLLPRLFDPQDGAVRIDGIDIAEVNPRELRKQIGVVTQETLLFDATIEENIRYGLSSASVDDVNDAARRAHVMSFAHLMPDGLKTGVGDRGHRLSGGQRQRIALARAILRDPAILILDEATSAVDVQSEHLIYDSLSDLARNRTTFIVTHALTQVLLDRISHVLVMDQGRILAFGPHEAVLNTCPAYQKLFDAQVRRRAG